MKVQRAELQQRLGFIDRTIFHALRACREDNVPDQLKGYVEQLGRRSSQVQKALRARHDRDIREHVDELARVSYQAQSAIHPADGMNYDLRSAVILTYIELSALRTQLDLGPAQQ